MVIQGFMKLDFEDEGKLGTEKGIEKWGGYKVSKATHKNYSNVWEGRTLLFNDYF